MNPLVQSGWGFSPLIHPIGAGNGMRPLTNPRPFAAVSGGVTPPPSSGQVIWTRRGVGIVGTTFASQWIDQSGQNNHLNQGTGANQPSIPGDGTLLFDGVLQFMGTGVFTLNQPCTVYLRAKLPTTPTTFAYLTDGQVGGGGNRCAILFNNSLVPGLDAGSFAVGSPALTLNTYSSLAGVFNGASSVIQVDGTSFTTANIGAANPTGFTVGGSGGTTFPLNCRVAEIIVYNVAHDATTRAAVIAYLNTVI